MTGYDIVNSFLKELEKDGYIKLNHNESYYIQDEVRMRDFKTMVRILTLICRKNQCLSSLLIERYKINKEWLTQYLKKFIIR